MPAIAASSDLSARRDLGVAWMNRGHSQLLLNNPTGDAAALAAYERAIAVLRTLPLETNASWANSFGAACLNHGQLLHRVHGKARAAEALVSFESATRVLRPIIPAANHPWPRRNLAGTLLNRANLLLDLGRAADAVTAAREAIALSNPTATTELIDADLTLKAQRTLCDALGQLLVVRDADQEALATEASDVVDDAMALIRQWAARDAGAFADLAPRFFHFGTQLYRLHQRHFLAEFIGENLILSEEIRRLARLAIDSALADRPCTGTYLTIGDPATERLLQTRRELETLRTRLAS